MAASLCQANPSSGPCPAVGICPFTPVILVKRHIAPVAGTVAVAVVPGYDSNQNTGRQGSGLRRSRIRM